MKEHEFTRRELWVKVYGLSIDQLHEHDNCTLYAKEAVEAFDNHFYPRIANVGDKVRFLSWESNVFNEGDELTVLKDYDYKVGDDYLCTNGKKKGYLPPEYIELISREGEDVINQGDWVVVRESSPHKFQAGTQVQVQSIQKNYGKDSPNHYLCIDSHMIVQDFERHEIELIEPEWNEFVEPCLVNP